MLGYAETIPEDGRALILLGNATKMLAEVQTIQQARELKNLALTVADWAKRKGMGEEVVNYARAIALGAERRMGEMLAATERAKGAQKTGGPGRGKRGNIVLPRLSDDEPTLSDLGITKRESAEAQKLAALPEEIFEKVKSGEKTRGRAIAEEKRAKVIENLESLEIKEAKASQGVFDVIVIDPPWPMARIELDDRPNAVAMPYPVMSIEEIERLKIPCAENCHVWLWTTHRFLPMAFQILEKWGLKYVCCFVWHKDNSYQPMGLPKYNAEFALYARMGAPQFIDTKNFWACFNGKSRAHSEKPEEFYGTVRRVTGGRRLDMFNRKEITGFEGWGNEAK